MMNVIVPLIERLGEMPGWPDYEWFVRERNTLPPDLSLCGARPSQEQKCLTVEALHIRPNLANNRLHGHRR
jgi:hypothetical protein